MAYDEIRYPAPRVGVGEKPLVVADVRANIERAIEIAETQIMVVSSVVEAMRPWNGKRVDKRTGEDVKKSLPEGFTCYYLKESYPWERISVRIWSSKRDSAINSGNSLDLMLTDKKRNYIFDAAWFESEEAYRWLRAAESIAEFNEKLKTLDVDVAAYNDALPKWRDVLSRLGPVYSNAFNDRR